jgi:hypothetical protein
VLGELFLLNQSQGITTIETVLGPSGSNAATDEINKQWGLNMSWIIEDIIELAGIACFVTFITFLAMAF